jgi:PHD and RING finger domain-containing protein 1
LLFLSPPPPRIPDVITKKELKHLLSKELSAVVGQDDVPESAMDLAKHKLYLQKLQYQEKASEEVKRALKPAFARKAVSKEQYKEIMRKVVSKVCNAYDGKSDVNVKKIKVDSRIRRMRNL